MDYIYTGDDYLCNANAMGFFMKDRDFKVFNKDNQLIAYGSASKWQVIDWKKAGLNVVPTDKKWGVK